MDNCTYPIFIPTISVATHEHKCLENRNRCFQKILETEYFGSRLFQFGFGSNRTNEFFLAEAKITKKYTYSIANLGNINNNREGNNNNTVIREIHSY